MTLTGYPGVKSNHRPIINKNKQHAMRKIPGMCQMANGLNEIVTSSGAVVEEPQEQLVR